MTSTPGRATLSIPTAPSVFFFPHPISSIFNLSSSRKTENLNIEDDQNLLDRFHKQRVGRTRNPVSTLCTAEQRKAEWECVRAGEGSIRVYSVHVYEN